MSKPRYFGGIRVVVDPTAFSSRDREKYIQLFVNQIKKGAEFSFSIDRLTTDENEKIKAYQEILKQLGQYFKAGSSSDKNGKFAFIAESIDVWRDNKLGTQIQDILSKQFQVNSPKTSPSQPSSTTPQQSASASKYTLPNSGVKVEFDADVIKFEVKANNCETYSLRLGVVNYLQSSEYIERDTANSNELYYSSTFSAKLNDNGLINTQLFLINLDRVLSTRDVAVGKLWCFSVDDYFYTSGNGSILKIVEINSAEPKPYKLQWFYSVPEKGVESNELVYTKDNLLELVRKGSLISLRIIEDDEFYLEQVVNNNLSKINYEIKVTKIDGIAIEFKITINSSSSNDSRLLNEMKELLWKNGYRFKNIKSKLSETPESDELLNVMEVDKTPSSNEDSELEQLNKDIAQLMFFKSILSPIDFEKKIELSQEIQKKQKRVNEINFYLLEKRFKGDGIFDELFEQSFTPINNQYTGVFSTSPDETDFFAPDGQKTKLSDALNVMIRTPQFKAWFGDWELAYLYKDTDAIEIECSKVLSSNFEPMVVWHGTGAEFSYFKFDTFPAAYFAVNREYSEFFAQLHGDDEGYVIPFFLNIRNPLDLTHFGTNLVSVKDFFDYVFLQTGMDMDDLQVNPLLLDPSAKPMETWMFLRNNANMLQKIASLNVFDGIHFYETNPNVKDKNSPAYKTEAYITFNSNQSKIADPDRGMILLASMKSFLLEKGGTI
jgi:hypothetical protein